MELSWSHTLRLPPPSYHHVLFDARRFRVVTGHFTPFFVVVMHFLDISSAVFGPSVCSLSSFFDAGVNAEIQKDLSIDQWTHFAALHQLMTKQTVRQKTEV